MTIASMIEALHNASLAADKADCKGKRNLTYTSLKLLEELSEVADATVRWVPIDIIEEAVDVINVCYDLGYLEFGDFRLDDIIIADVNSHITYSHMLNGYICGESPAQVESFIVSAMSVAQNIAIAALHENGWTYKDKPNVEQLLVTLISYMFCIIESIASFTPSYNNSNVLQHTVIDLMHRKLHKWIEKI